MANGDGDGQAPVAAAQEHVLIDSCRVALTKLPKSSR